MFITISFHMPSERSYKTRKDRNSVEHMSYGVGWWSPIRS